MVICGNKIRVVVLLILLLLIVAIVAYYTTLTKNKHSKIGAVYYINLDRRPDRKEHFLKQCKRVGIPSSLIRRFPAVDGSSHVFTPEEDSLSKGQFNNHDPTSLAVYGNILSHYRVFEDIVRRNYECALVFQDDAVLSDDFVPMINKLVKHHIPPDAEMINIGFHKGANMSFSTPYDVNDHKDRILGCSDDVNEMVCRLPHTTNPCSLAYVMTRKGARNFVQHFKENGLNGITDMVFNHYLISRNIFYATKEVTCSGAQLGSDIF